MLFALAPFESASGGRDQREVPPVSAAARAEQLLQASGIHRHVPMSEQEVADYVEDFIARWERDSPGEPVPTREGIQAMMAARDDALVHAWTQYLPGISTKVTIGSFIESTSPFILPDGLAAPLVAMASGLQRFAAEFMLGVLTLADGGPNADIGERLAQQSLVRWAGSDRRGTRTVDMKELATLDQENTTYAVGFANTVFTWAYFHEAGHFRLGHLKDEGIDRQGEEFAADSYGLDRLLELMCHEMEIRKTVEFGSQVDHAPLMILEMMDLAYRLVPGADRRISPTHPPPLSRRDELARLSYGRFSDQGQRFYSYWVDLLAYFERGRFVIDTKDMRSNAE